MDDLRKLFGTNPEKEVAGVWHKVGTEAKILVARMNNPRATQYRDQLLKPYARQIRKGTLPDSVQEDIANRVMARHVLLDWRGLTLDGEEIAYSEEMALTLLGDEEFKDFRDLVIDLATDAAAYKDETDEEAVKN